jgi:hypothetical protein
MTMTTKHHDDTAATHPVSKTTIVTTTVAQRDISVTEAVQQAIGDTSKPSSEQTLVESRLPDNPMGGAASQLAGHLRDASPDDGSKGKGESGFSLTDFNTPADKLRDSAELDPAADPKGRADFQDWLTPDKPSREELEAKLGHGENQSGGGKQDSNSMNEIVSGSHGRLQRPDGPPDDNGGVGDNPGHQRLEGMLSADGDGKLHWTGDKWQSSKDYTDANGHEHHQVKTVYDRESLDQDDEKIVLDIDKTNGTTILTQHFEDGSSKTTIDIPSKEETIVTENDGKGNEHTVAVDLKSGKVLSDDHPKGGGASIPDEDHRSTVPDGFDDLLRDSVKGMYRPSHDGDNVDPAGDDIPGTVVRSDIAGPVVDNKERLLGGDRGSNPDVVQDGGGGGPGRTNPQAGPDYGPDHDETPQTNGPEERNNQHAIKHDVTGSVARGTKESSDDGADTGKPVETPAQAAAHGLPDRLEQSGDDPWGTRGRYDEAFEAHKASESPASPAETAAQKAAHQLEETYSQHQATELGEPIKPHERFPEQGLIAEQGNGGHAFTDLIRAAQNPAAFGHGQQPALASESAIPGSGWLTHLFDAAHQLPGEQNHTWLAGVSMPAHEAAAAMDHHAAPVLADMHVDHH